MEPGNLKFSFNWNKKLDCETAFSTIRLKSGKYYLGAKFHYWLEERGEVTKKGFATVVYVHHLKIEQITEAMARLDTGYSRDKCIDMIKTMYKNIVKNWDTQELTFMVLVKE